MSQEEFREILEKLSTHKGRILEIAHLVLTEAQFNIFKKIFLDEFGRNGFESELSDAIFGPKRNGASRNIHAGKEVSQ